MQREEVREAVYKAVYSEAISNNLEHRDAHSHAENVCDRLRLYGDEHAERAQYEAEKILFYDLRKEQDYVYPNGKHKVKTVDANRRVPFVRDPKTIDSIVIHQTACEFGVSQASVVQAKGNRQLALARRALDVACHALAFREGFYVAAHDLLVYVNHGNRLNDRSLGLEIEGRFPGLLDDVSTVPREDLDTTWGGPPTELTELQIETACCALEYLVREGRELGCPIEYIYAHRQSSDDRRSDPGEGIWKHVVLGFAVAHLGLRTQPKNTWREGYSVPVEWDPSGYGHYNDKPGGKR